MYATVLLANRPAGIEIRVILQYAALIYIYKNISSGKFKRCSLIIDALSFASVEIDKIIG